MTNSAVMTVITKVSMNDGIALEMNGGFVELGESDLAEINGGIAPGLIAAGALGWAMWKDVTQRIEDNPDAFTFLFDWYYTWE